MTTDQLIKVKGIGKAIAKKLVSEGIDTPTKLVERLPDKYLEKKITPFYEASIGEAISMTGVVATLPKVFYIRRRLNKMMFQMAVDKNEITVSIFNRDYLKSSLTIQTEIVVTGKFLHNRHHFTASEIVLKKNFSCGIEPVYHLKTLGTNQFRKLIMAALPDVLPEIRENLPDHLIKNRKLPARRELFSMVHSPGSMDEVARVETRIKYEEFLHFSLRIEAFKKLNQRIVKAPIMYQIEPVRQFIRQLPFELTPDQKEVTNEIFKDLKAPKPMNRLLQGDVGSGKTICAVIAALAVVSAGHQVAFMSPTEILAKQHFQTLNRYFESKGISVAFLSGSVQGDTRQTILHQLKTGRLSVIVGTHALIQEAIAFHRLGLVVIDEQHRFGVGQRRILREKGGAPDLLFLSATPIPRTLAIALFGDMDISTIRTLPSGRQPIETHIVGMDEFELITPNLEKHLNAGSQAYVICPLINESDTSELVSVQEAAQEIRRILPERFTIATLHGKMKPAEKATVMEKFSQRQIAVLVSTTVVEVGMDFPNATIMIVLNAERFGLSQLHQIRGRVGRGQSASICYLVINPELDVRDRLEILETTNDGFEIASADLDLRGPGEVFGEEQTGIPRFRMANIVRDKSLLDDALVDAKQVMEASDPQSRILVREAISEIQAYFLD